ESSTVRLFQTLPLRWGWNFWVTGLHVAFHCASSVLRLDAFADALDCTGVHHGLQSALACRFGDDVGPSRKALSASWLRVRLIRNRGRPGAAGTKRLPQMDCDGQSPGRGAANSYSAFLKSFASNSDRIGRAAPAQTSDTRDILSRFAMTSSLQQTS